MIKLLIVDDSALMRKHLTTVFGQEGDFETRTARNGVDALAVMHEFRPDVITLDINMPDMDGLTCLSRIMVERPCPVVMVSSLTEKGAMATLEAMAMGAVDYIPKPGGTISLSLEQIRAELLSKVRAAARSRPRRSRERAQTPEAPPRTLQTSNFKLQTSTDLPGVVLIGVSTGGPRTLEDVLPLLPADFPWAVVVAQHMPASFTQALARRMAQLCALSVQEVSGPVLLQPGCIYVGRGDADVVLGKRARGLTVMPRPAANHRPWHPSADELVESALQYLHPRRIIGVLLTGMGYDGAEAMTRLKQQGGRTIAEAEETAVIFGMPAELIKRRGAGMVLPAPQIARQLQRWATHPGD